MALYDTNGFLGVIIEQLTSVVTGDYFATLLFLFVILLFMLISTGMPFDLILGVMMPIIIVLMAFSGQFVAMGLIALIYAAVVMARLFFLR